MANRWTIHAVILIAFSVGAPGHIAAKPDPAPDPLAAAVAALTRESTAAQDEMQSMKTEEKKTEERLKHEAARIAREVKAIPQETTASTLDKKAVLAYKESLLAEGCVSGGATDDKALLAKCNPKIAEFNRRYREVKSRSDDLLARAKKLPGDREQLTKDTLKWAADKKRLNAMIAMVEARLAAIQSRLAICPGLSTKLSDEELKLKCGNVQFDGARASLPPCDTPACKAYDCAVLRRCR